MFGLSDRRTFVWAVAAHRSAHLDKLRKRVAGAFFLTPGGDEQAAYYDHAAIHFEPPWSILLTI
jgi:hypothetical protein